MKNVKSIKIIAVIFSLFIVDAYSQISSNQVIEKENGYLLNLSFEKQPFKSEGKNDEVVNYFNSLNESKPGSPILPSKTLIIAIPPESKIRFNIIDRTIKRLKSVIPKSNPSLKLGNDSSLIYHETKINPEYFVTDFYPSEEIELEAYTWIRDYYCAIIKINTHRYNWGKREITEISNAKIKLDFYDPKPFKTNYEPIGAFDSNLDEIILNYQYANNLRSFRKDFTADDTTGNWIDFGAEYLKLGVATDGVYRIFKTDLENFEINIEAINPLTFKLYYKGNEQPLYVLGEDDGRLDETDFIEFYGTRNYAERDHRVVNDINEPYSEYIDRYSDTTIYWLTWGGEDGSRYDTSSYSLIGVEDTIDYYSNIIHGEANNFLDYSTSNLVEWQNPEWIYNESWIWERHNVGSRTWPFNVSELVPAKTSKMLFRVQDFASDVVSVQNAHLVGLSINSDPTIYDSSYLNKFEQKILSGEFSSNLLQNGQNTLKTHSFPVPNSTVNILYSDWYEIEYPRYLSLINDSLKFIFNQSNLNSFTVVKITNAQSSDHILYKISDHSRRVNSFNRIGSTLFFADTLVRGEEFFITTENRILAPKIYYKKQFENLVSSNIQADYILISHQLFNSAVNNYIDFIESNYEVTAKSINILDIYDQFNYGFFSPEPIREFLYQSNQLWTNPKPSYVFLVGEANYDYHNYKQMQEHVPNFVPSFGHPVSDNWYVIWDSVFTIPQMFIGRLPVNSNEELLHYLNKHSNYLTQSYNNWNKTYFLLSGGFGENEKLIAKSVNDFLIPNYIQPPPVGGYPSQLYATENPLTNFGPLSQSYIDSVFDNGGIVVSYIGHSGTKIWDNGIEEVNQLKNKFNKYPLINDFGCSTGKFAEPDIVSFSEAFTNGLNGDAISYLGNSSLGFTSTSYNYPKLFFEQITNLENTNISSAHISAKLSLLENYGYGGSIKLFVLTNSLLGDPIISLSIPPKPNLNINLSDIIIPPFLDDNLDSIEININYRNLGRVDSNSFSILVEDYLNGGLVFQQVIQHQLPLNEKLMNVLVPVKNRPGEHTLVITFDSNSEIDEIYESDNSVTIRFNVVSSSVRAIVADSIKVINDGNLVFLNSVLEPESDTLLVRLSSNPDFQQYTSYYMQFDTLYSPLQLTNLLEDERYWYQTSLQSSPETIFETNSFIFSDSIKYNFNSTDSLSTKDFNFTNSSFINGSIQLAENNILLDISSAGYEDGGVARIELDGIDYPQNSFGCGFHIVVIDTGLIEYEDYRWFNYWNVPNSHEAFYDYLNTIDSDKLVAIAIGGSCGGFVVLQELKDKLKEFGSAYIDSVTWYTSWFILGRFGSAQGSVPEGFSSTGPVGFDTTFVRNHLSGSFSTNLIGNSGNWKSLNVNADSIASNSQIAIRPIIHNVEKDTLTEINLINGTANISYLNNFLDSPISFLTEINSNVYGNSPLINQLIIDYDLVPELGTNYQVVSIASDTVLIGEDVNLNFYVYNVGETTADSFRVIVDVINENNLHETIFERMLDSLESDKREYFEVSYITSSGSGSKTFLINIDAENKVNELFEDNNFYTVPFFIKPDTTTPSINITFDDHDIIDGDYISDKPIIKTELSDPSLLPITDPSSVEIYLNEELIPPDTSILTYHFSETNPKVTVEFTPELADGEYFLRVLGKNASGNLADSLGVERYFLVSNEAKLLYVYNYPNPFKDATNFTFKLTQIPDEIKIKIFTIAGRLVKEMKLSSSLLNFDFNKIYWDGRDEDGDRLANGVYLYKVIMKAGDKSEAVTQKLAIVR